MPRLLKGNYAKTRADGCSLPWFGEIEEKNNYIFLYINRVNAYIVDTENLPKEDITLLRAILKINIKS